MHPCPLSLDVDPQMEERTIAFLEDRSADALTGPRRMGRTPLMEALRDAAEAMGMRVWTPSHPCTEPDLILLDHWSELPVAEDAIQRHPDADVVFGQDLCHQVPAAVRHREP